MKPYASDVTGNKSEKSKMQHDLLDSRLGFNMKALILAMLTALIASLIPAIYWLSRNQLTEYDLRAAITRESESLKYLLQNQFNGFELIARSVKGFIDGSKEVTADEFKSFVKALKLQTVAPGLQGVGFSRLVTGKHPLLQAQDLLRKEHGNNIYAIHPPGEREAYAPIIFMEPMEANEKSIGFDILSSQVAKKSAMLSSETGNLISTEKISLVQDGTDKKSPGFVLYLAVRNRHPGELGIGSELGGWVDIPFRLLDVIHPISDNIPPGLQLIFYEEGPLSEPLFLHGFSNDSSGELHSVAAPKFSKTDHLYFAGRKWYFNITPTEWYIEKNFTSAHHWIAAIGILLSVSLGVIIFLIVTSRDRAIALAIEMTSGMRDTTADLNDTLDAIPDLLFEMDLNARYLALRTSHQSSLNMPIEEMMHKTVWEVLPFHSAEQVYDAIQEANATGRSTGRRIEMEARGEKYCFELSIARKHVPDEESPRFIVLSRDITERTRAEQQVHQLAYFDVLTGLPNRRSFLDAAPRLIKENNSQGSFGAIFMIDLDNLKSINDHWGHQCGDAVLMHVASSTKKAVGDRYMVARFGGDELIAILTGLSSSFDEAKIFVEKICQDILLKISDPVIFSSRQHYSYASIGVVVFGADQSSMDEIISGADSAMYHAKNAGKNTYRFFDRQLQKVIAERIQLEHDMQSGLDADEFYLVYQPQVGLSGHVAGAEVLCRWRHPKIGTIPPSVFIEIAERSGFISHLGQWVLRKTCETLHSWSKENSLSKLKLAVNVSAKQFHHPDFMPQLISIIEATDVNPAMLELELTESIFSQDADEIPEKMKALKSLGICFSLDDFGTGYSSLNYLKRLPLDQLKIDQSFVRDVTTNSFDASIVKTIISLGESLGLEVIAEGVETEEQHQFLIDAGCRNFQGFLFSKPLFKDDFIEYFFRGLPSKKEKG